MRPGRPTLRWFIVRLTLVVGLAVAIIGCELFVELDEVDLLPVPDAGAGTGILPQSCSICSDAPFFDALGPDAGPDAEMGDAGPEDTGAADTGTRDTGTLDTGTPDTGIHDTGARDGAKSD